MMDNKTQALKLKDEGNSHFSKRNYAGAESCYSRALVLDPSLTSLYTNRARCRFNLSDHDGVISDCDVCLSLLTKEQADDARRRTTIKAHYYKSKSLLELNDTATACEHASLAYEACRATTDDKSLSMTMTHLLKCKNVRWERREKTRRREAQELEAAVMGMLERETGREMEVVEDGVERSAVEEEGRRRVDAMREIFERARKEDDRERNVPEWLVDDISFNVMVDPVVTHTGRSYERASIQAAINNNAIDPVTREPLHKGELVPNIVLKQACEWFLENNGWAYDW